MVASPSLAPRARPAPLRVLIAEDEPVPRRRLARMLGEEPGVQVVAACSGGDDAVARIVEDQPDVVFLDVQMPDLDGFEVIEAVGTSRPPAVVFVTAYDAHAVRAFDCHACDYLLKPFDQARLHTALDRARARLRDDAAARRGAGDTDVARLQRVLSDLLVGAPEPSDAPLRYLTARVESGLRVMRAKQVDWIETKGNYVHVHIGRESYRIRQSCARLEARLDARQFARIHRRFLVNIARVYEVRPWIGGDAIVILRDGTRLRLSRHYREQFFSHFLGEQSEPPSDTTSDAASDGASDAASDVARTRE